MKLFITSDIHGYYDQLKTALDKKGFDINNPNQVFVSLGDCLDRGKQPNEILKFINSIPDNRKILIRGNHEDLMEEMLERKEAYSHDIHNGTFNTIYDYLGTNQYDCSFEEACDCFSNDKDWKKYINSCIDYWENDKHIFVHGWIPTRGHNICGELYDPELNPNWRTEGWEASRWLNGMDLWSKGIVIPNKTIWCGHWHTSWGHHYLHKVGVEWEDTWVDIWDNLYAPGNHKISRMHTEPFKDNGIVAMDACTAVSGKVNCETIGKVKKIDVERK